MPFPFAVLTSEHDRRSKESLRLVLHIPSSHPGDAHRRAAFSGSADSRRERIYPFAENRGESAADDDAGTAAAYMAASGGEADRLRQQHCC